MLDRVLPGCAAAADRVAAGPVSAAHSGENRPTGRERRSAVIASVCEASRVPTDEQIEGQIEALESEREKLRQKEGTTDPTRDADAARLEEIRVDLDRLWDLLRQRRALRNAGSDPDAASERSAEMVEKYWQ